MNNPNSIIAQLETDWLGKSYYYFPEIGSTNDWLKERAENLPHGTAVVADFQSAGKGRLDRQWNAPPESSILASFLFKPDWPTTQLSQLSIGACIAIQSAVTRTSGLHVHFKWPNDLILLNPKPAKFGGILLETIFANDRLSALILGFGINVNLNPSEINSTHLPATSLSTQLNEPVDRTELFISICSALELEYLKIESGLNPIDRWRADLINLNQPVTVQFIHQAKILSGVAIDVTEQGYLLVQDNSGDIHTLVAGDVSLQ